VIILLFLIHSSGAQTSAGLIGARSMSIGYASACLSDEWSVFNNVAGLAKVKDPAAAFTYHAFPYFIPFNRMAATVVVPVSIGVSAVGVYRFGDALYNEQILSCGFANTMGLASLGVKLNYIQYHIEGFGSTRALSVSAGGIATLTPAFSVGAHIININQPVLTKQGDETLPAIMVLGFGFKVSGQVFIASEIEKDLSYALRWKTGLEYRLHKKFTLRTGFNINPDAAFLGFGCKAKKFLLDYGLQWSMNTGVNHQAGVCYRFKTRA
jgi:hypothetical protein